MFYRITVVNWSHFIPRNDKSTEGTVKSSQAACTQVQQTSILVFGIENVHVRKRPAKHKHIHVSVLVQYWFYFIYCESQTALERTVAIT